VLYFDLALRSACLTLLCLLTVKLLNSDLDKGKKHLFLLSSISVSALIIGLMPQALELPKFMRYTARLLDVPHLVFLWLFCLSLLQKKFEIKKWHMICGMSYCIPIFYVRLEQLGFTETNVAGAVLLANIFTGLCVSHLLYSMACAHIEPSFYGVLYPVGYCRTVFFVFTEGLLAIAGLVFFIGTTLVTIIKNVPLNNRLLHATEQERDKIWQMYSKRWVFWNHVRTVSGLLTGLLLSM
jgi:uncharacterized membrane protein